MSYPVYYVPSGDVLPILFDTFAGSTGASITMSGLAVTDIKIYKDGGVTQRASEAGYTLLDTDGIDFDGLTGIHGFSIDTGDNTDAGFYTVGAWFHVVVSAITVDSQTVSFVAAAFRLMPAEGVAGKPKVDVDTFGGTAGTFASGRPEVNTSHIGGSAISQASGVANVNVAQISGDSAAADNLESYTDGTTPMPVNTTQISGDATAADNLEAALDGTGGVTLTAALTGNITGNLSGSVGSVTGAVGSVTGAVGSVTGAVGSVTGAVGSVTGNVGGNVVGNVEGSVASVTARVTANTDQIAGSATPATNLRRGAEALVLSTCAAGSTTTAVVTNLTEATNDHYNGRVITFTGGALAGQSSSISGYDGTTKTLTVVALTEAPADTDAFVIS